MCKVLNNPRDCNTVGDFDKFLRGQGYTARQNGTSHIVYSCADKPSLSIPCHNMRQNQSIPPGTKRNIVKLILGDEYYQKA
jgi:predicted RNA binding protein YcfA (HicA-like mRNA interferase family)